MDDAELFPRLFSGTSEGLVFYLFYHRVDLFHSDHRVSICPDVLRRDGIVYRDLRGERQDDVLGYMFELRRCRDDRSLDRLSDSSEVGDGSIDEVLAILANTRSSPENELSF